MTTSSPDKQRFDISLEDLQTLLVVADLGSFSGAARHLNLSQPSVSNRVRRLEEKLTTKLLERDEESRTYQGRNSPPCVSRVDPSVSSQSLPRILFRKRRTQPAGRVAATMMVATVALPNIVRKFGEKHPDIVVRVQDRFPESALEAVRSGACDMGVMVPEEAKEGISFERLTSDVCVVITHRNHPVLEKPDATLRVVLSYPLLSPDGHTALRRAVEEEATKRGLELRLAPEARRVSNVMTLLAMAAAGLGVCIHPSSLIPPELRPTIGIVRLSDCKIVRSFGIATSQERRLGAAAKTFREYLKSSVGQRKAWIVSS